MSYIDLDLNLKVHPLTRDIVLAKDSAAIRNAVKYLCLYGPFDNPYEFGTEYAGVYEFLFELDSSRTIKTMIYTKLMNLITTNERRVIVNDIDVNVENGELHVTIKYTIKSTSLPDSVKFTVIRTS